jgi:hypothetical protein
MPAASGDPSQLELVKALLQQKGLLATGGNIRSIPFSDEAPASSDGSASTGGSIPSPSGAGAATRPPGATPIVKNNQLIDPATGNPVQGSLADDWWKYLLAGAGGAGLAELLRRRKGGSPGAGSAAEDIPVVEGEVIDPLSPMPEEIVNGSYTDVPNPTIAQTKQIAGPDTAAVLAERNKQLPSRNRPRANPVPSTGRDIIPLPDTMSDIPPEEIERAKTLAQQLIANRTRGNAQRANTGNLTRRAGPPTGPTDKNAEEGLLNTIIKLMRDSGAARIIPKAL